MVPAFVRSLSARILLGFAVLIITFGGTIVWVASYLEQLADEMGVIRTGYLKVAFTANDLHSQQQVVNFYLKEELADEGSPNSVTRRLKRMREKRDLLITELLTTLEPMTDLPRDHPRYVRRGIDRVESIRDAVAELAPLYETLLAAPPIQRTLKAPSPAIDAGKLEAAQRALMQLREDENDIASKISQLNDLQAKRVEETSVRLERNAARLLKYTLEVGVAALMLGLLITIWVSITLRPLGRLRDAAKRIARGEHGMRIGEKGPLEVAELAREFNVMGQAIEERERELVRSERLAAVGKMAAMITHEVRNPLSSIALNTELLGDELDSLPESATAEARALCRSITNEVDRLTAITEEYLAFARLPKPRLQPESVNQVVSSLATFVREDLAARGVVLEVSLGDDVPRAMLDEGQLRQSLLNLVRNATEALVGQSGRVWLSTRRGDDGWVEVEVKDDGPGIEAEAQARLFDPFFSTKSGGTGLGLALTHQIVMDHGGEIRVVSLPGKGASFVVSLPEAPVQPNLLA